MLTILITVLSGFFFSVYKGIKEKCIGVFAIYFMFSFGFCTLLSAGLAKMLPTPDRIIETDTKYIENLNDISEQSGSFILGSGSIDNNFYYTFYEKHHNQYRLRKILTDDVVIEYTEDNPRYEVTYERMLHYTEVEFGWNWFSFADTDTVSKILYIPENSIIKNYKLDAK